MATQAQLNANRANSQLSTGPKTVEGKDKVAHNAIKNALTGATVLLPTDDAALYRQQLQNAQARWAPASDEENLLVQSIVDTQWRLQRIPALISGICALGRLNHADLFIDQPEPLRSTLLETYIHQTYRRDLSNLALQERRLRSHYEKDIEVLKEVQAERRKRDEARIGTAADLYHDYKKNQLRFQMNTRRPFDPREFGFEFSMEQIEHQLALQEGRHRRVPYLEIFTKMRAAELRRERLAAAA